MDVFDTPAVTTIGPALEELASVRRIQVSLGVRWPKMANPEHARDLAAVQRLLLRLAALDLGDGIVGGDVRAFAGDDAPTLRAALEMQAQRIERELAATREVLAALDEDAPRATTEGEAP